MADAIDPNELPQDLTGLSAEELDTQLEQAQAEAQDLAGIDPAEMTDDQIDRLESLAGFADRVGEERANRAQAAETRAARAEAARARLTPVDEGDDGEPGEGEDEGETGDDEGEQETPDAVAASASRRRGAPAPRRNPVPAGTRTGSAPVTLVAAADVGGGFTAGQELASIEQMAEAFVARSGGFPDGEAHQAGVRHQYHVAQMRRNFSATPDGLWVGNPDFKSVQDLFEAAAKESRLPNRSLAASGGWCAPSEIVYGIPSDETLDGIVDLPTVGVNRGGMFYTPGPDFSDIYSTAGFAQTEAQAIAGTTKSCVEVDCPDFQEVRLDAVGYCVKAPLLTRAAYNEAIVRWISGTAIANAHKIAGRLLSSMATSLGTAVVPTLTGTPFGWSLLTALELAAEGQRQAYRLSDSETMEVVIPRWARAALRADLANRNHVGADSVSNTQLAQHFTDRNLSVQYVLNWQELGTPKAPTAFPGTMQAMIYPAGTFVRGNAPVVNLDTVYDTGDLQTNVYTAAFVEDGVLLAKMKHGGVLLTVPCLPTGEMGAADLNDPWGTAQSAARA